MDKYTNIKPAYKRNNNQGKNDGKNGKKPSKCTLKTGTEYIRGVTGSGSGSLVSSYGTMNSKSNTSKNTGTYGRSSTLGKSNSIMGGGKSSSTLTKKSTSTTGRRSWFGLGKK